jgi:5-carboxymethyl-2-hydroxymuconate isomerase
MPHVTLEYSSNLTDVPDLRALFASLHEALAGLGIALDDFKSRAYRCDTYVVGTGAPDRAFVHVTLAVLDRRSAEAQRAAGELTLGIVHKAFAATGLDCDVTVEVREMRAALYFKARSARP